MDVIEGRNPVIEALKSGRAIGKIVLDANSRGQGAIAQILSMAVVRGIAIEYVARTAIDLLSSTGSHQGVIAFAAAREFVDLDDLFAISRNRNEPAFYLVLDGIEDPHNLGAMLRTAEAAGVHGVVIRERRAVGITPVVVKASAGAVEYIAVARVTNISQAIVTFKKNSVWVVGIDAAGQSEYESVDLRLPTAIVIGGEGKGLSDLVRKRCDLTAFIPMRGKISSLNASVAAAVVIYEALRQRNQQAQARTS
jgi:23S rRNA (guanosine2251-2'-O)-methyltransferase